MKYKVLPIVALALIASGCASEAHSGAPHATEMSVVPVASAESTSTSNAPGEVHGARGIAEGTLEYRNSGAGTLEFEDSYKTIYRFNGNELDDMAGVHVAPQNSVVVLAQMRSVDFWNEHPVLGQYAELIVGGVQAEGDRILRTIEKMSADGRIELRLIVEHHRYFSGAHFGTSNG